MDLEPQVAPPEPRNAEEIFIDLRALAQREGALHEISALIYRDWVVTYNPQDGRITDSSDYRLSTSRLHKNELMLLIGLMVQVSDDRTYSKIATDSNFSAEAGRLLQEFHDRILKDAMPVFDLSTHTVVEGPNSVGLLAREAIYYGAESFYSHQLLKFSRIRYRADATWLLQHANLSIRPIVDIAKFVAEYINQRMSLIGHLRATGHVVTNGDLTNSLLIAKSTIRDRFGPKADAFIAKFATAINNSNSAFLDPFSVNQVAIAPLIDLGDAIYVANQYRLFEAIYESPFFWMANDEVYLPTHAAHRGAFTEKSTAHILSSVFGKSHVYENVTLNDGSKNTAGEIDVLVVYGEFVLIVQAKSKRITLKARAGELAALTKDFKGAIQDPYKQALSCAQHIGSGARCIGSDGTPVNLPRVPRIFPVVVLSDPFPASTLLSRTLLERGENTAPVIWDLGVLDCVAQLLPTPVDMLLYMQCRTKAFDTITSDSEYNYLGFHIRTKLAVSEEVNFLMIDRDFALPVDDYMLAIDFGMKVDRPKSIVERLSIPLVSELLAKLRAAGPNIASVVVDLYDFSSDALESISQTISDLRDEVGRTGKAIKAFSVPTATGGVTYAVTSKFDVKSCQAAELIGRKHKYSSKSDRWYVIVDSVSTEGPIDGLLPLVYTWVEDENEAANALVIESHFRSTTQIRRPKAGEGIDTDWENDRSGLKSPSDDSI